METGQLLPGELSPRGPGEPQPVWWTPERRLNLEQTDMASGALKPVQSQRWQGQELPEQRQAEQQRRQRQRPLAAPEPRRDFVGGEAPGETEDSGTDPDSSQEGAGPCRSLRSSPRNDPRPSRPRGRPGRKAAASSLLRAGSPELAGFSDPRQGGDARDDGVQPEAEPRGAPARKSRGLDRPGSAPARLEMWWEGARGGGRERRGVSGTGRWPP